LANVGHPSDSLISLMSVRLMTTDRVQVEYRGIRHLAKNERDVGHPIFVAGTATPPYRTVALSFVIPSEAEGPAVSLSAVAVF